MSKEHPDTSGRKLPDPFSVIEKAGDLPLMLQLLSLLLFFETLLLVFKKKNLLNFPWAGVDWSGALGELLVAGMSYALLLSVVLPAIEACMFGLANSTPGWMLKRLFSDTRYRQRPPGGVADYELRTRADAEQSSYLLAMVQEAQQKAEQVTLHKSHLGTGAFRVMAMLLLNLHVSSAALPSTPMLAGRYLPADWLSMLMFLILVALFSICLRSWWHDRYTTIWIPYPPLYQEIMAQQKRVYGARTGMDEH